MGYTLYYKRISTDAKKEKTYKQTIKLIQEFVLWAKEKEGISLSGYTAHTKPGQYGGIKLNGKGSDAHEDFCLREHFNENEDFQFCKTEEKPYDIVVKGSLLLLEKNMPGCWDISCDGDKEEDFEYSTSLVKKFLVTKHLKKSIKKGEKK